MGNYFILSWEIFWKNPQPAITSPDEILVRHISAQVDVAVKYEAGLLEADEDTASREPILLNVGGQEGKAKVFGRKNK